MDDVTLNTTCDSTSSDKKEKYAGLKKHSKESNALVKDCIKTALITLAANKEYTDVTVTELCKKAGVSRMAFYRNYSIINDVLREIALDLTNEIVNVVGSPFRQDTRKEWYIKSFEHVKQHKDIMDLMLRENFQIQWMGIVNESVINRANIPTAQKYQRLIWAGGYENAVAYWLNNKLKETPEEMAEYCLAYLPHSPN